MTPTYGLKLAIVGSRGFSDYPLLCQTMLDHFYDWDHSEEGSEWRIDEVISGGAIGADSLGARWADEHDVALTVFRPDWEKHGKRAGFLRNEDIIKASTHVLAFWDSISRGTANSLSIAKRLKKPTLVVYY